MTHHKQVRIEHGEMSAEVDEKIAPLILALWRAGIETFRSCQHHGPSGKVWIGFASADDVAAFLELVVGMDGGVWSRRGTWGFWMALRQSEPLLGPGIHPEGWEFHLSTADSSLEPDWPRDKAGPCFLLAVDVLFPRRDLRRVLNLLEAHLAAA
jgi:hypothetical protein